jgi:hypothetical protein
MTITLGMDADQIAVRLRDWLFTLEIPVRQQFPISISERFTQDIQTGETLQRLAWIMLQLQRLRLMLRGSLENNKNCKESMGSTTGRILFMRDSFFDMKDILKPLLECMDHLHITHIRKEQKSQRALEGLRVIRDSTRSRNRATENIQDKEKRSAGRIDLPGGRKSGLGMLAIRFENDSHYTA